MSELEEVIEAQRGECTTGQGSRAPSGEELTFEEALQRWEEIVAQLERGTLTLEESLRLYEEGIRLRNLCLARLSEAEKKLRILREQADGTLKVEERDELPRPLAGPAGVD
ncbi:MAG TPA: exodeoxyribonuclease VII small subunit [Armatimonadetes bacterium]|nr:exodeoxyribonuclease VII small subunit [Armatimonadota bacterium]